MEKKLILQQILRWLKDKNRMCSTDVFNGAVLEWMKCIDNLSFNELMKSIINVDKNSGRSIFHNPSFTRAHILSFTESYDSYLSEGYLIIDPVHDKDWEEFKDWTITEGLCWSSGKPFTSLLGNVVNTDQMVYLKYYYEGFRYGSSESDIKNAKGGALAIYTCREFMDAFETWKQKVVKDFHNYLR